MKPRLSRPLLTALVSGAIVAGGAVYTSPATAAGTALSARTEASESPAPETSESVPASESPAPETSTPSSEPPVVPVPSDSTSVEPSAAVPSSAAPSSAAPSSAAPSSAAPSSATPRPSVTTTKPTPPPRDTTKPTGTFKLNAGAFWTGQKLVLTQTAADYGDKGPGDTDATLRRKVSWGDGYTSTLAPGATSIAKQYSKAGTFKVTVTITDRAGNAFTTPAKSVKVTVPGKAALTKKTVYQGVDFGVKVTGVPAGTKSIGINWGDGYQIGYKPKNGTITSYILYKKGTSQKLAGNFPIKIAFYNKLGASSYRTVGTVKVLKDSWKPVMTVTKPAKSNKVSSWKTVRGTVTDKGSGTPYVWVTVGRFTLSGSSYCLTPAKKWKKFTTDQQYMDYCGIKGIRLKVTKGKWSLALPKGLGKGAIRVDSWTWDYADNYQAKIRVASLPKN